MLGDNGLTSQPFYLACSGRQLPRQPAPGPDAQLRKCARSRGPDILPPISQRAQVNVTEVRLRPEVGAVHDAKAERQPQDERKRSPGGRIWSTPSGNARTPPRPTPCSSPQRIAEAAHAPPNRSPSPRVVSHSIRHDATTVWRTACHYAVNCCSLHWKYSSDERGVPRSSGRMIVVQAKLRAAYSGTNS